jgi:hypothetical protein
MVHKRALPHDARPGASQDMLVSFHLPNKLACSIFVGPSWALGATFYLVKKMVSIFFNLFFAEILTFDPGNGL